MPNQQKGKPNPNRLGSGFEYHGEHASNVPDYGANTIDPKAKGFRNSIDNSEQ